MQSSNSELVPPGAFVGGRDCDGTPIYVGRSFHRDDNLPAKVIPSKGCAYVCWNESSNSGLVPPGAFVGGRDCDGTPIYVGRSFHEGDNLPAKVIPSKGCAFVCWYGKEFKKKQYEVLVGKGYEWVASCNGSVPRNAVPGGFTRHGETLYIGRCAYRRSLTVGKIHPSHFCLYIPFAGKEWNFNSYEVLIRKADRPVGQAPFKELSESSVQSIEQWIPCSAPSFFDFNFSLKLNF